MFVRLWILFLLVLAGGCATPPGSVKPVLADLEEKLSTNADELRILAADDYAAARRALDEAKLLVGKGGDAGIAPTKELWQKTTIAVDAYARAVDTAEFVRLKLVTAWEARARAAEAGAGENYRVAFRRLDVRFANIARAVARQSETPELLTREDTALHNGYLLLETSESLLRDFQVIREKIATAVKEGAQTAAPVNLQRAKTALVEAEKYFRAHAEDAEGVEIRLQEAKFQSDWLRTELTSRRSPQNAAAAFTPDRRLSPAGALFYAGLGLFAAILIMRTFRKRSVRRRSAAVRIDEPSPQAR